VGTVVRSWLCALGRVLLESRVHSQLQICLQTLARHSVGREFYKLVRGIGVFLFREKNKHKNNH
jgi:hypothetical protein